MWKEQFSIKTISQFKVETKELLIFQQFIPIFPFHPNHKVNCNINKQDTKQTLPSVGILMQQIYMV